MSFFNRLVFPAFPYSRCLWPLPAALLGELRGKRCCLRCAVSRFAAEGTPACRFLPLFIASSLPVQGEQVPLRNGKPVKLSVSSGAWLLSMRPIVAEVS